MKKPAILFYDDRYLALACEPLFKAGGATQQVVAWVKGLQQAGADVKVMGAHSKASFFAKREDAIISYDPDRGIPKLRYLYIRIPALVTAVAKARANYLYYGVPSPFAGLLAALSRCLRKKFILRVSNDCFVDERSRERFDPFRHVIFSWGFRFADSILCQNDYQFSQLSRKYPNKVFKISNPYLGQVSEKPAPFEARRQVAWIGIFQEQKNLPRLLEIARALPEVKFTVAGGNDKRLSRADARALNELKRLENVHLVGFVSKREVLSLLEESFLLLNTSHYEGFSNTFLEAFSRGTPVFTYSHNDPDGIISKHRLGESFSHESDVAGLIRGFLAGRARFESCSSNCVHYMKKHHDLCRQSQELLKIVTRPKRNVLTQATGAAPAMTAKKPITMDAQRLDELLSDDIFEKVRDRCNGMLDPRVYRTIFEAAKSASEGDFVEVGTAHGAATVALALGVRARPEARPATTIYSIEKIMGGSRAAYGGVAENTAIIEGNFRQFGVSDLIQLRIGDSEEVAAGLPKEKPISLLMLDADGRIDRDFALYYNRLTPGAKIIIDDCKDVPRVKRAGSGKMKIDLKHKLTFHLVQYFCGKGLLENLENVNGTAFARKPLAIQEDVELDFAEIVRVYRELVFSEAAFPEISREVVGRGLKAVHGSVKKRPALYKAWKKAQGRVRGKREQAPVAEVRG